MPDTEIRPATEESQMRLTVRQVLDSIINASHTADLSYSQLILKQKNNGSTLRDGETVFTQP